MHLTPGHGILLPTELLHSSGFAVLAAFVAINTVMYASLALAKVLPKVYLSDLWTSVNRRAENRSIHPDGTPSPADPDRLVEAA